ncbi:MAG: PhzF family phenazine biosynthesis protein [Proteobacteria bacterium]|nr:PhzF family phenazine biosynthesis protein [Pseudomonadota bacterium]
MKTWSTSIHRNLNSSPSAFNHYDIAEVLGLPLSGLDQTKLPVLINLGQSILLVKLSDKQTCLDCRQDFAKLRLFCQENSFYILTIYVHDKDFLDVPLRTQVFLQVYGYLEDPATGSGNAALGFIFSPASSGMALLQR